jgi:AAA+ superfamily predicted ATPase
MPDPSMAQLRQYITQFVGMGLGNKDAKKCVPKSNFVLFYGPMGTGKSLMVRALATECDAMVIDLSVSNLEGNCMDKTSTLKNLYMAFTVAKEF